MFVRLQPYLCIAGIALLFFGDLVLHPTHVLYSDHSDLLAMHLPMKRFLVRSWQHTGDIPLWNPYSFGGMPFVHDVQVAAFYPPHFPLYALPEDWIGAAMSWLVMAHVVIAGWCMYGYAARNGLGRTAAFVAALGYMFAGKWLLHVLAAGHYVMIPLAWLPLVLLWLEQGIRQASWRRATWAGAAFALLILGTHPQITLYAGLFIALWSFVTVRSAECRVLSAECKPDKQASFSQHSALSTQHSTTRWLLFGTWSALVAAALAAIQLFPALEGAPEASRAGGVAPSEILAVARPALSGLVGPGWTTGWEDRAGLGLLWLAAAAMAPLFGKNGVRSFSVAPPNRESPELGGGDNDLTPFFLVCLLLLSFALGGAAVFQWLPGFRLFQIPVRMLMLLSFPVAFLAGCTTQGLIDARERGEWRHIALAHITQSIPIFLRCRRLLARVLAAGGLLALCGGFWTFRAGQEEHSKSPASLGVATFPALLDWIAELDLRQQSYWIFLLATAPIAWWLLSGRCRLSRRSWGWAWATVLLVDLWTLTYPYVAVRSDSDLYTPSACVRHLVERRAEGTEDRWRVLDWGAPDDPSRAPLGAALPMLGKIELEPVLGYNSFDVRRYKEYLQFVADDDKPVQPRASGFGYPIIRSFPIKNKALLDVLGVRYLLQPETDVATSGPLVATTGRSLGWDDIGVCDQSASGYSFLLGGIQRLPPHRIYWNRNVLPRVFLVSRAAPLAERPQLLQQLRTTDFRREVLLEDLSAGQWGETGSPKETGLSNVSNFLQHAVIRDYSPNRVVVEAESTRPGYLVLADTWFPGWTCRVDGEPAQVYRADYLFRAVQLPAGAHRIVFTFAPLSYRWGKFLSLFTLVTIAVLPLAPIVGRHRGEKSDRACCLPTPDSHCGEQQPRPERSRATGLWPEQPTR